MDLRKFDHPIDELGDMSPFGDFNLHPASQRFRGKVDSLFPVAFVAVIDTCDRSRAGRERVALVATESFAGFVEADDWMLLVVWSVREVENVLHLIDELSIVLWRNLPILREIRFQGTV